MFIEKLFELFISDFILFINTSAFDKIFKSLNFDHEHKVLFNNCEKLIFNAKQIYSSSLNIATNE